MPTVRIHRLGLRELHGVMTPQGSIVERWDDKLAAWVYVTCVHPDDAEQVAQLHGELAPVTPSEPSPPTPPTHITFHHPDDLRVNTFGGYSNIDGFVTDNFGIQLDDGEQEVSVSGLPADAFAALVCIAADHLYLNGYRFEIQETGEQDLRHRLVIVSPKS
jgi:hypothetical protein